MSDVIAELSVAFGSVADVYVYWKKLSASLQPAYEAREASQVARLLIEDVYGVVPLYAGQCFEQSTADRSLVSERIARLQAGEPLQYVLGYAYFLGRKFRLTHQVLIPRPETEQMTAAAIRSIEARSDTTRVLDIGTGSGCIAISLALAGAKVDALDRSIAALECASYNAQRLSTHIRCLRRNFLTMSDLEGPYDLLVSNPPYIPINERASLESRIRDWEPAEALFVPEERPLLFYEAIAQRGAQLLKKGGELFIELHSSYGEEVRRLFEKKGYHRVRLCLDLSERVRWIEALA